MPIPAAEIFTPEMRQLVEHIETSLHHLAKTVQTREQAIAIKSKVLSPIGVINSRFNLPSTTTPWRKRLTEQSQKD